MFRLIHLFIVVTAIMLAFIDANACDLNVDIVGKGRTQRIEIEKCGIAMVLPVTDEELEQVIQQDMDSAVMKRVCKVLKCKNAH